MAVSVRQLGVHGEQAHQTLQFSKNNCRIRASSAEAPQFAWKCFKNKELMIPRLPNRKQSRDWGHDISRLRHEVAKYRDFMRINMLQMLNTSVIAAATGNKC
jgi:hypothetical protein